MSLGMIEVVERVNRMEGVTRLMGSSVGGGGGVDCSVLMVRVWPSGCSVGSVCGDGQSSIFVYRWLLQIVFPLK